MLAYAAVVVESEHKIQTGFYPITSRICLMLW